MNLLNYLSILDGKGFVVEVGCGSGGIESPRKNSVIYTQEIVTPENILGIFKAADVPEMFEALSVDIDGYDYEVVQSILSVYRPKILHLEINEKIPPPVKFYVKYAPGHWWKWPSHFYGVSIALYEEALINLEYSLVSADAPNAIFIRNDINVFGKITSGEWFDNYKKQALVCGPQSCNYNVKNWLRLSGDTLLNTIRGYFSNESGNNYTGKYELWI
jgi:hypothetical protein